MGKDSDQGIFVLDSSTSSGDPSANSWGQVNGALKQASATVPLAEHDHSESDEDVIVDPDDWMKELEVMVDTTSPTSEYSESDDEEDYDLTEPERVAKGLCKALEPTFNILKIELEYLQEHGANMPSTLFTVSLLELATHSTKLLPKLNEAMSYVFELPKAETRANCLEKTAGFLQLITNANQFFQENASKGTAKVSLELKEEKPSSPARRSPTPTNPEGPFWYRLKKAQVGVRPSKSVSNMGTSIGGGGFPSIRLSQSFT